LDANRLILDEIRSDVKVETKARIHRRVIIEEVLKLMRIPL